MATILLAGVDLFFRGKLDGHLLRCPWHGWTYDVRTGLNDFDHAIQLQTFEVRVEDGEVKVAI